MQAPSRPGTLCAWREFVPLWVVGYIVIVVVVVVVVVIPVTRGDAARGRGRIVVQLHAWTVIAQTALTYFTY